MADDRDARAALGERQRGHSADAGAASGDEGGLAAEWRVSRLSGACFCFPGAFVMSAMYGLRFAPIRC